MATVKLTRCGTGHVRVEGVTDPRGGHYTAHRYRNGGGHHGFRWAVENSRGSQVEDCGTLDEVRELFGAQVEAEVELRGLHAEHLEDEGALLRADGAVEVGAPV